MKKIITLILIIFTTTLISCKKEDYIIINEVKNYEVDVEEKITISTVEDALVQAISKAEQSVVGIICSTSSLIPSQAFGSGVIIAKKEITHLESKYYVITNRHVIWNNTKPYTNIKIYTGNSEQQVTAALVYYDKQADLALISFTSSKKFVVSEIADSSKLKKGRYVIAIGSPYDYEYLYNSVTVGNVSHPNRRYEEKNIDGDKCYNIYIQHDAAINPGNSGGGLFNINGELLGINTWKIVSTNKNEYIEGLGFSIPIDVILNIVSSYIDK